MQTDRPDHPRGNLGGLNIKAFAKRPCKSSERAQPVISDVRTMFTQLFRWLGSFVLCLNVRVIATSLNVRVIATRRVVGIYGAPFTSRPVSRSGRYLAGPAIISRQACL